MIYFIIIVGIIFHFSFTGANNKEKQRLKNDGGFRAKYDTLITNIIYLDLDMKILQLTENSIVIGKYDSELKCDFYLLHIFGKINVIWTFNHFKLGKYTLK